MGEYIIKRRLNRLMNTRKQKNKREQHLINELCFLMNKKKIYTQKLIDPLSVMVGVFTFPAMYKILSLIYQTDGRTAIHLLRNDVGGDSWVLIYIMLFSITALIYLKNLIRKDEKKAEEQLIQEAKKQLDNPNIKAVLSLLGKI
jgi:uncharacterized membrane protein YbjE (DUF340 family)